MLVRCGAFRACLCMYRSFEVVQTRWLRFDEGVRLFEKGVEKDY